jgi:hypothetical protein
MTKPLAGDLDEHKKVNTLSNAGKQFVAAV